MASSVAVTEGPPATAIRLRRWTWLLPSFTLAAFFLPLLGLYGVGIPWLLTDSDTGWHIRMGEWILQHHSIPTQDLFSFTKAGESWIAWEWLSDVVMGWLHHSGGLAAVVIGGMAVLCFTALVVYRTTLSASGHHLAALSITMLAVFTSRIHWLARPHLVSLLMLACFHFVLTRSENETRRWLAILPPLTLLWVNLHPGFVLGILLLLIYALGTMSESLLKPDHASRLRQRARQYLAAAGSCAAASLLNPYGWRLHHHILEYLSSGFYFQHIEELQPVSFHSPLAAYFETTLILAIGAGFWSLRQRRFTDAIVLFSWAHLGLISVRNVPVFAILSAPSVARAIAEWVALARGSGGAIGRMTRAVEEVETGVVELRVANQKLRLYCAPLHAAVLAGLGIIFFGTRLRADAEFRRDLFPVAAVDGVTHLGTFGPVRLYSNWQWGGYLIYRLWPSIRVFNDGRTDFYGPEFTREGISVYTAAPNWQKVLEKYGIDAALLPVSCPLTSILRERHDWVVVYEDKVSVLFRRTQPLAVLDAYSDVGRSEGRERAEVQGGPLRNDCRLR